MSVTFWKGRGKTIEALAFTRASILSGREDLNLRPPEPHSGGDVAQGVVAEGEEVPTDNPLRSRLPAAALSVDALAGAVLGSVVGTGRRLGHDPFVCLRDVFARPRRSRPDASTSSLPSAARPGEPGRREGGEK